MSSKNSVQISNRENQAKSPVHVEFNEYESFRIVTQDAQGHFALYDGIATLESHGVLYMAVSNFFAGSGLEPEVVYAIQPVFGS